MHAGGLFHESKFLEIQRALIKMYTLKVKNKKGKPFTLVKPSTSLQWRSFIFFLIFSGNWFFLTFQESRSKWLVKDFICINIPSATCHIYVTPILCAKSFTCKLVMSIIYLPNISIIFMLMWHKNGRIHTVTPFQYFGYAYKQQNRKVF